MLINVTFVRPAVSWILPGLFLLVSCALPAAGHERGSDERAARADSLAELARRLDLLARELERLDLGEAAAVADQSQYGLGPAASKVYRTRSGVSIGGYGEMLYENFDGELDNDARALKSDQVDFLRAIVYFGYKFSDSWLFNSEIELEHASTGESGSASVEFAYVDYLWRSAANLRVGLVLVPMGLMNELHEPTVFLGARRPAVEQAIIPTTWRENGAGVFGDIGEFSYRTYLVNGLDATGFSASGLRGGRQKGSKAKADGLGWVGRLDWTGRPGLLVGTSVYAGNSGQNLRDADLETLDVLTTIVEGHVDGEWRGLQLRALAALADVDEAAELNGVTEATAPVAETLAGYYVELGYDLFARWPQGESAFIPYMRWESLDTQNEVPEGSVAAPIYDTESLTVGIAYRPIDPLVVKADYQDFDNEAGTGLDQFNVAFGYIF
jgi:hypothetical protein